VQVIASTIGARCSIGGATVLRNAYIFDDVTIGPNCVLESCIVGAGVRVGEGSRIARGSLVADGVKLGPGTVLRAFERVSKRKQKPTSATIGEDGSDEDDADSELEEAEQRAYYPPRKPHSRDADRATLICRPILPFAESRSRFGRLCLAPERCTEERRRIRERERERGGEFQQ
jgi:hypothetical protein